MGDISVIVPIHNVEKYLYRCIDSILAQTFTDFELILVDDGSPDNCGEICDMYTELDSRIILIHQHNGGLSSARNVGLDLSFTNINSEWITFIDSDDWIHMEYLYTLLHGIQECGTMISTCSYKRVSENADSYTEKENKFMVYTASDYYKNIDGSVTAWGKLYNKHLFDNVKYPVGKIHEDEFVTYRLVFSCKNIAHTDSILYYYYFRENSITNEQWRSAKLSLFEGYEKQLCFFERNNNLELRDYIFGYYINSLVNSYFLTKPKDSDDRKIIKKKLKFCKKKYKPIPMFSFRNNKKIYEILYPKIMKIYNFLKILKDFKKNS